MAENVIHEIVCCGLGGIHGMVFFAALIVTVFVFQRTDGKRWTYQKTSLFFILAQTLSRSVDLFLYAFFPDPSWADCLHGYLPSILLMICYSILINYFNKIYFFLSSTRPPSLESVQTSASLTSAHASSSINPPSSALSDTEAEASSTKPLLADSNAGMYVGIPALLPHSDTRETSGQRPCQQQRRFCGALTPGGALVLRIFVASALVILNGLAIVAWIPALVFASVSPGHVFDEYEKAFVRILGCICIALAAFHMTMGLLFYHAHRILTQGLFFYRERHKAAGTKSLFLSLLCSLSFVAKGLCQTLVGWLPNWYTPIYLVLLVLFSETIPLALILAVFSHSPNKSATRFVRNLPTADIR